jgi:hypothetical protein
MGKSTNQMVDFPARHLSLVEIVDQMIATSGGNSWFWSPRGAKVDQIPSWKKGGGPTKN